MLLRVLMVGAVASLGLELPTRGDLSRWLDAGRARWEVAVAAVRVAEPEAPARMPEAPTTVPEVLTAAEEAKAPVVADGAFEGVVGRMAAAFAERPAAAFEPVVVGEDLETGLAFALNRESCEVAGAVTIPTVAPEPSEMAGASRGQRLAAAIRLTGQAVHAWATLLREGPAVASVGP
jgi:hypothetical protein